MNYLFIIVIALTLISFYIIAKKTNQYIKDEIEREYQKEKHDIYHQTSDKMLIKKSTIGHQFSNN